jgi:hypothetical protein
MLRWRIGAGINVLYSDRTLQYNGLLYGFSRDAQLVLFMMWWKHRWAPCHVMCTTVLIGWDPATRGRYWSALRYLYGWDHGRRNLKTPTPYCRLYWSFVWEVVYQFCRFWIWPETEGKTTAEYGLHSTAQFNIPPPLPKVNVHMNEGT